MKKRWLLVVLCILLALLPLCAHALEWTAEKNYLIFPELDGAKLYFRNTADWTIVTPENYLEHMDLLLARGDREEDIHARFAQESLIFEAYSDRINKDACIRMECTETELSREIWHLRHLSTKERNQFKEAMKAGEVLEKYDTFTFKWGSSTEQQESCICGFTTRPPQVYESGMLELRYYNGKEYILSYAVLGRRAGRSTVRSSGENDRLREQTPIGRSYFKGKMLPKMPDYELDSFPMQVDVGKTTITGQVSAGSRMTATLNGESVPVEVSKKGAFSLTLTLDEPGDYDVTITTTHSKNTDRVEHYTLNASASRTPLSLTAAPDVLADAGPQTVSGETQPGADVIVQLDRAYPVDLVADEKGHFTHTFDVMDDQAHQLTITAMAEGKDDAQVIVYFLTEYETVKDGIKAFSKNLTKHTIGEMAKNPEAYIGEKVKISVVVKEVTYTEDGLGILCTYNPSKGSKHAKTPLYLTLYGYGQDLINEGMVITVYGTVTGAQDIVTASGTETRLAILLQYGTYLTSK
ncbi:MAG: hypothetical protein ACI4MJ_09365 [Aristaeellaceae bacterium]